MKNNPKLVNEILEDFKTVSAENLRKAIEMTNVEEMHNSIVINVECKQYYKEEVKLKNFELHMDSRKERNNLWTRLFKKKEIASREEGVAA